SNSSSVIRPVSSCMYSSVRLEVSRCLRPSSSSRAAASILRKTQKRPRQGANSRSSSISTRFRAFLGVEVQLREVVGRKRPALLDGEAIVERAGGLLHGGVEIAGGHPVDEAGEPHDLLLVAHAERFGGAAVRGERLLHLLRELVAQRVQRA